MAVIEELIPPMGMVATETDWAAYGKIVAPYVVRMVGALSWIKGRAGAGLEGAKGADRVILDSIEARAHSAVCDRIMR